MSPGELLKSSLEIVSISAGAIGAVAALIGLTMALTGFVWLKRSTKEIELSQRLLKEIEHIKSELVAEKIALSQELAASKAQNDTGTALDDQIHRYEELIKRIGEVDSLFRNARAGHR